MFVLSYILLIDLISREQEIFKKDKRLWGLSIEDLLTWRNKKGYIQSSKYTSFLYKFTP